MAPTQPNRAGQAEPLSPAPQRLGPAAASIGDYLIQRLAHLGVRDVFGIPGDYVLGFYVKLAESSIRIVGCTREDCAGFAADAYARVNGIGARVRDLLRRRPEPVQLDRRGLRREIAGGRHQRLARVGRADQQPAAPPQGQGLPHAVRRLPPPLRGQYRPEPTRSTAFREIDRVLDAVVRYKRPGYIELPRDLVHVVPEVTLRASPWHGGLVIPMHSPRPLPKPRAALPPPSGP